MNPDEILRNINILSHNIRRRLELENSSRTSALNNDFTTEPTTTDINEYVLQEFYSNGMPRFANLMNFFNESFEQILETTNDISQRLNIDISSSGQRVDPSVNDILFGFSRIYGYEEFVPIYENLINNTNEYGNLENIKITLSKEEFDKKIKDVNDENRKDCDCGICKENKSSNLVMLKECEHTFCKECIETWLTKYNVKCPICRRDTRDTKETRDTIQD